MKTKIMKWIIIIKADKENNNNELDRANYNEGKEELPIIENIANNNN